MALKQNTIYVYFKGKHLVTSKSQYQYNHGQFLYFADLDLPQTFEVHFSNRDRGDSKPQVGSNKLVEIPDEYYWSGALMIYAWIYLHTGKDDGETVYEVRIPLSKRAKPTDEEPLPQQQGVIDRTIAELNNAVNVTTENANKTEADKTQVANIKNEVVILKEEIDSTATTVTQKAQEAVNAANASEISAQNSARYENSAHNYSDEAKQYAQSALESKNIANQKSEIAANASTEAMGYRDEALEAKNQAVQTKQNIVDYRDETKGYRDETFIAKDDAQTIKGDVQSLKTQIDKTATDVETNALDAKSSADLSYRSAISADNASLSASQFADEASDFADSASQSASQAEEFKNQSATNVTHYPKVVDGYWYVWDASNDEYVNTNVDARGVKGDDGEDGIFINIPTEIIPIFVDEDGKVKTETTSSGSTVNVFRGEDKIKFELSISSDHVGNLPVSVFKMDDANWNYMVKIIKGVIPFSGNKGMLFLNFTIDGKTYTRFITLVKIQDGKDGIDGKSGVYIGTEAPTDEDIDVWIDSDGTADDIVTDVQINGTSIVSDGVANIPSASSSRFGLVRTSTTYGVQVYGTGNGETLGIIRPTDEEVKNGTSSYRAVTPVKQHQSVFYGLAKAAGDTTQSASSNEVGVYTEEAKTAIRTMLGLEDVYQDYSSALTALGVI